jgi:hypothetical protein
MILTALLSQIRHISFCERAAQLERSEQEMKTQFLALGFRSLWLLGLLVSGWIVQSQDNDSHQQNKPTTSFYPVAELTKPPGASTTLQHARIADPKDWPATFYSVHPGGSCTSTLVGPRVLLTAAHCTPEGASVSVKLAGKEYEGVCSQAASFSASDPAKISEDWALCLMTEEVTVKQYETVNLDPSRLRISQEILLTGFGCTQSNGTGGNDGNYRIGEAKISSLPAEADNYIQTKGQVALCFGDSGGPAFLYLDAGKKRRLQVSVNSRVGSLGKGKVGGVSYLSSTSTATAETFFKNWAEKNHVTICGLEANWGPNCQM